MSTKKTVQTERLRNIADGMRARGYIDSAFEVKHAADAIDELRAREGFDPERYSKVCRLLEEALTTMSEWGCEVGEWSR